MKNLIKKFKSINMKIKVSSILLTVLILFAGGIFFIRNSVEYKQKALAKNTVTYELIPLIAIEHDKPRKFVVSQVVSNGKLFYKGYYNFDGRLCTFFVEAKKVMIYFNQQQYGKSYIVIRGNPLVRFGNNFNLNHTILLYVHFGSIYNPDMK